MKLSYKKRGRLIGLTILVFISTTAYNSDYFEIAKQVEIFSTLFKEINMNYVDETNPAELMQEGIKYMLKSLDPYTTYLTEQDVESARMNQSEAYVGIGATINLSESKLIVIEVFKGLPADEVGLKAGDEITYIDGNKVSDLGVATLQLLKGKRNSSVLLSLISNGETKEVRIKRAGITPKAVPIAKLMDDGVGYIALDRFTKTASKEVENALKLFMIDEAKGIILDLRNNPGGLLQEAVKIVNLFVPKGQLVVSTKSNIEGFNNSFITRKQPLNLDIPLIILINEKSASASEIVAGALQDLDRAVVIGERSFGKGLVQRPKSLPYGGQLKVTISRYYTPSGRCIQALDYKNRGEDGEAIKYQENDYKAFNTKNGRTVYDGGGVTPDVLLGKREKSKFIQKLIDSSLVFEFANNYYHNNNVKDLGDFKLGEKGFNNFKKRSLVHPVFLEDKSIREINELYDHIKKEGLQGLEGTLKELKKSVNESKTRLIELHKSEITTALEGEIIKRFFYRKGLYTYYLVKSKDVKTAQELLGNTKSYLSLLNR
jgi:carboxyl-terminal processing protease